MENLSNVFPLCSEENYQVENDHTGTPGQVFNVYPENLTAIPCVKNVVDRSNHSWHHRECNLEKRVPVHTTIVLSSQVEFCPKSLRLEKPAVTNPEKLETSNQREKLYESVRLGKFVSVILK